MNKHQKAQVLIVNDLGCTYSLY